MESEAKKTPKLRVLCLHGYNNTSAIMQEMLKDFQSRFSPIMDIIFTDAPYGVPEPPIPFFVKKGFKTPYLSWVDVGDWR